MDAKTPLVSVVMSVYNGGQWLTAAIESIIHQTYINWEFIIVDDNSNLATKNILNSYKLNPKFKIITNESNLGLTKNLNTAIAVAHGEFIARMDADDISMPDRIEKQVSYLIQKPDVSVVGSFIECIDETGNQKANWNDDRNAITWITIKSTLPWKSCLAHPTVVFRKSIFEKYKYNESQIHSQDWDLWLQLAADNVIIEKINEPLLQYRVHNQSITSGSLKKSAFLKIHSTYKIYLKSVCQKKKFNLFNLNVLIAFKINWVKLILSRIKRLIKS